MVKEDKEAAVVELGRWKVGILKGRLGKSWESGWMVGQWPMGLGKATT